jgi:hypothetical protein
MDETRFYDQVAAEIDRRVLDRGLWTRAYAEADGDHARAEARYIQYRVAQLMAAEMQTQPRLTLRYRWNFWFGAVVEVTNGHLKPIILERCAIMNPEGTCRSILATGVSVDPGRTARFYSQVFEGEHLLITCKGFSNAMRVGYDQLV